MYFALVLLKNIFLYKKGMFKMNIAYVRVSTVEQNEGRQIEGLKKYNIDNWFTEKVSAKDTNRPELKRMIEFVREGDTIYIWDFSRLSRSVKDLLDIVETLQNKNVHLVSVKENLDTSTPTGKLMLTMIGAINEFERTNLLERQREGIAIAKAKGKYKGRKPIPFDAERFKSECAKWRSGEQSAVDTMKKLGMKPNRFYRWVREMGV